MNSDKKHLTNAVRDKAKSLVKNSKKSASQKVTLSEEQPSTCLAFSDHPDIQELEQMKAVADIYKIDDPFFRVHEARGGALTSINGKELVNFATYDYLGLNSSEEVSSAAKAAIDQYGVSTSASRLVSGERTIHGELEAELASYHEVEDAVVFVSGHATNISTIDTLLKKNDLVIYDALSHNSIVKGATLSNAARMSFPHNDLNALSELLIQNRSKFKNVLVVVEGLYSMDGDIPNLPKLISLKQQHNFWLMVDEAHSTGVLGQGGRGICEHFGVNARDIDIWMGTLSKTFAASGGYIAGSKSLIELLKAKAAGFVYSVGLSPPLAAAALKSLEILRNEPERVHALQENGKLFLQTAKEKGLDTGLSEGFCVTSIIVGSSLKATKLSEHLYANGYNVLPIIYPAVPMNSARLRFFITYMHTAEQIIDVVKATTEGLLKLNEEQFGDTSQIQALR